MPLCNNNIALSAEVARRKSRLLAIAHKTVGSFSHLEYASGDEYFGTQELEIEKPKMALVIC